MKYNTFICPIFNHFIQPSPPPIGKCGFVACPPYNDLKISPNLYAPPSLIDMTTYNFPVLLVPQGKPVHQAIHYSMSNFGPLFDHYLAPKSPQAR